MAEQTIKIELDTKVIDDYLKEKVEFIQQLIEERDFLLAALRGIKSNAGNAESVYLTAKQAIMKVQGEENV